jgi:hypothetical protein
VFGKADESRSWETASVPDAEYEPVAAAPTKPARAAAPAAKTAKAEPAQPSRDWAADAAALEAKLLGCENLDDVDVLLAAARATFKGSPQADRDRVGALMKAARERITAAPGEPGSSG